MENLQRLITFLKRNKKTIAVAESVTGGYVSYLLTKIPGSSKVFKFGVVVYSIEAKHKFFKIPLSSLTSTEGVSEEVARTLAVKVRKLLNTDLGVSLVGFAGPKARKKMKGVVFMGIATKDTVLTRGKKFKGTRDTIRQKASYALIDFILKTIRK